VLSLNIGVTVADEMIARLLTLINAAICWQDNDAGT
jgi:hypothetical protein